jgi:hypothetical protein
VPQSLGMVVDPISTSVSGISICPCISSDGQHLSTAVVIDNSFPMDPLSDHKLYFFCFLIVIIFFLRFYSSSNGFMTYEILLHHFEKNIFPEIHKRQLEFATVETPIPYALLLPDGCATRRNKEVWEKAAALNIDVFILPAHTSHLVQPLDRNPFSVLKRLDNIFLY